ncbi:sodium-dependent lysophosphatidylcholine symporter 1 [Columba livia]|uniref:Sodium-dependent lysophosphatidylcholine symporter 1 n=1 Tax=Columba livia TaxID=8932 RepID=A0A2I0M5X4_COLLI|nr:sodium-dependent lysophosphatidylcholine symporter 1 [Columba livia]
MPLQDTSAVMHPGAHDDAALHRSTQEGALPQRRVPKELQDRPGLTLCGKVCYAIGGIPYQMTGNALGFFFQIFLLDVVQLEPIHASLILFLGRAWDAVTDPAIGFLVSKSPRRKYGKLVPWIAGSMPFGVLCYCLMWSTLSDATPASLKFLWYLFMYSFFQTCMTLIIPALVAVTQVTRNFLAFVFPVMVAGCSMAVLYLLPWSMLPDAVDDFMLRNPGCPNLEALFYSFYVFFNKFAGGLAVGISTLSLHFAGYHAGDCTYNPSIVLTLQLLMAPIPISLLLIAIIIFCLHPINEERRKQMKMELEAMGHQLQRGNRE